MIKDVGSQLKIGLDVENRKVNLTIKPYMFIASGLKKRPDFNG